MFPHLEIIVQYKYIGLYHILCNLNRQPYFMASEDFNNESDTSHHSASE